MKPNICFFISGLGLGHATRSWAVIQNIISSNENALVWIFTWGVSYDFFIEMNSNEKMKVFKLNSYLTDATEFYSLNLLILFKRSFSFLRIWVLNNVLIHSQLKKMKNLICVTDGDFHILAYIFKKRNLFSITQGPFILNHWIRNFSKFSFRLNLRFIFYKIPEFMYNYFFSDQIFSPTFYRSKSVSRKIKYIPLIVRNEFIGAHNKIAPVSHQILGVLGSGSHLSSQIRNIFSNQEHEYVYDKPNRFGIDNKGIPLIASYSTIASQCGYSSLSEVLSMDIKLHLFPIHLHPEQAINSIIVSELQKSNNLRNQKMLSWASFSGGSIVARKICKLSRQS